MGFYLSSDGVGFPGGDFYTNASRTYTDGSTWRTGAIGFSNTGTTTTTYPRFRYTFVWPEVSISSADAKMYFQDGAGSGNVKFDFQLACYAAGGLDMNTADPTFNTASSSTQAVGTGPQLASVTGIDKTNCSAGKIAFFDVTRDNNTSGNAAGIEKAVTLRLILNP